MKRIRDRDAPRFLALTATELTLVNAFVLWHHTHQNNARMSKKRGVSRHICIRRWKGTRRVVRVLLLTFSMCHYFKASDDSEGHFIKLRFRHLHQCSATTASGKLGIPQPAWLSLR